MKNFAYIYCLFFAFTVQIPESDDELPTNVSTHLSPEASPPVSPGPSDVSTNLPTDEDYPEYQVYYDLSFVIFFHLSQSFIQ